MSENLATGPYAVMHMTKYKSLGGIGSHIDRKHTVANVDSSKTEKNENLFGVKSELVLPNEVELRIQERYRSKRVIRKDAVKAIGVILTGSHERMQEISSNPTLFSEWKEANYKFACQVFDAANLVRFTLHMDEKTPHIHCVFVPITADGALSAKSFMQDTSQLRKYQDLYAAAMAPFGFQRGIHKELTGKVHVDTVDYYRDLNIAGEIAKKTVLDVKASNVLQLNAIRNDLEKHVQKLESETIEQKKIAKHYQQISENLLNKSQEKAYRETIVEVAKESLETIKKNIFLIDFAVSKLGWAIDKAKSTEREVVLRHPQYGKILAHTTPRSTGHWVFSRIDGKGGGTLIDLLLEANWSWKDIKALSQNYAADYSSKIKPLLESSNTQNVNAEEQCLFAKQAFNKFSQNHIEPNYFTMRGIDSSIPALFPQIGSKYSQAIFLLFADVNNLEIPCSTLTYSFDEKGNRKKYFQNKLPRGLSVLKGQGNVSKIVVTESPIDALSYHQLNHKDYSHIQNTMYVSTCGSLSQGIKNSLQNLFKQAAENKQEIILSLDKDSAGEKMQAVLESLLRAQECKFSISLPSLGKDWNEELMTKQQESKDVMSENHFLKRLEISPEVYKTIDCIIGAQSVSFSLYKEFSTSNSLSEYQKCSSFTIKIDENGIARSDFAQGLPIGVAVFPSMLTAKTIVVLENPIEALRHKQEQLDLIEAVRGDLKNQQEGESHNWEKEISNRITQVEKNWNETMYVCYCKGLNSESKSILNNLFKQAAEKDQKIISDIHTMPYGMAQKHGVKVFAREPLKRNSTLLNALVGVVGGLKSIRSISDKEEDAEAKETKQQGRKLYVPYR